MKLLVAVASDWSNTVFMCALLFMSLLCVFYFRMNWTIFLLAILPRLICAQGMTSSFVPRPSFYLLVKGLVHESHFGANVGVSMEMPPFTMSAFQNDSRIVSWLYDCFLQLASP